MDSAPEGERVGVEVGVEKSEFMQDEACTCGKPLTH
jgi:hypothetical protein